MTLTVEDAEMAGDVQAYERRDGRLVDPLHSHNASSTDTLGEEDETANSNVQNYETNHDEEIRQLARRLTRQSEQGHAPLFPVDAESRLDPNGPGFDGRAWAKAFYQSRMSAANGTWPRKVGIAFKNLRVYGFGTATDYQSTVGNTILSVPSLFKKAMGDKGDRIDILHDLEGLVESGEMLCVLGPPGSGCSTTLRTIAGDTHGFHVGSDSILNYEGIRADQMATMYRGEAIYTAEVDAHFPHLTVGDTLYFAARSRCPKTVPEGVSRREYATHLRDVIMAMFGISHTKNTRVGDDFVRGVSGGERKRVTIAEAALGYSPLQCWDNSTRGLDSANAIEFCRTLRTQADVMGATSCVAIYQAPQAAYDVSILAEHCLVCPTNSPLHRSSTKYLYSTKVGRYSSERPSRPGPTSNILVSFAQNSKPQQTS
jgi:ABC-type multidrug transport system ATPase subunit